MANTKIRLILLEKLYPGSQNKTWSWLWLRSWAPYCKIQAYIEVGKTIRPLRHDLNQIPYAHTVEVKNRFNGLDLVEVCLKDYGLRFETLYRRWWPKRSQRERNARRQSGCQRQIPEERREVKDKGERERYTQLNAEFERMARRDKKAFLKEQYK